MPTYQITTDKGTYRVDTQGTDQNDSSSPIVQGSSTPSTGAGQTSSDLSQASSSLDNMNSPTPQQTPPTTDNMVTNVSGDVAKGFLNSIAGTVDKVNGAAKLLNNVTHFNLGTDELSNVSNSLKQMAQKQPTTGNPISAGIGQFVGSTPDAIAEFAGTGGGIGFIARSAALQAAQEYNKNQSVTDLVKGAAMGAAAGAVINKIPGAIDGTGKIIQKWGQTAGKTYLKAVTGASDKEINEIMDSLPNMDLNPKNTPQDYGEAKENANQELSTLRGNNADFIKQQKSQNDQIYAAAKSKSDDIVNDTIESNKDAIEQFKLNQSQVKEDFNNTTSANMMQANEDNINRLADVATQTTNNTVNAKKSLDNTLVNIFGTASNKVQALEEGATKDVSNAHASLENSGLDYVPTHIIAKELDNAIGGGFGKYYKTLSKNIDNDSDRIVPVPGGTAKLSTLPPEVQEQYRQQPNISKIAQSGNTPTSLTAESGIKNPSVMSAIKLINDTRKGLVDEFSKTGKTSLIAMDSQSDALESAINKGFYGKGVPEKFATILSNIKQAINPTKLFDKYSSELSHLEPLAEANKTYSSQIDNLRNSLNLYKDNVDGAVNPQKVFSALDRNDSGYIAKLKQADESLPKEDRIFSKVQDAYNNYRTVESSEKNVLLRTEKEVSNQRLSLNNKFNDMKKQLNIEQRQSLFNKLKETRMSQRSLTQQERSSLNELHSRQEQGLNIMQQNKDKQLQTLQESINKRLNSLHLLHMVRGTRAAATGTSRIFQNVAEYRSIDGLTNLNPIKFAQGKILSKIASPMGAAANVKWALNAPNNLSKMKQITNNDVLKKLLATKLSGR